jgi:LytS/YehU family sensor histidine kinase
MSISRNRPNSVTFYASMKKIMCHLKRIADYIKTYLSLKKIFYPTNFYVHLKPEGKIAGVSIAPLLLLLSLVENCFEEFLHKPTLRLKLNMDIKSENGELYFLISCKSNLKNESEDNNENYEWLKSLKRIKILCPGTHSFDTYSENGITNLVLVLEVNENLYAPRKEEFVLL